MEIVIAPTALPGNCYFCLSVKRDSFIDTKLSNDADGPAFPGDVGAVYICNMCVDGFARMYNYISEDNYKSIQVAKEEADRINYELIKRVGALEESLRALANAGYRLNDDGGVVVDGGYLPQTVGTDTSKPSGGTDSVGVGARTPTESSDDSDLAGIYPDESSSDGEFVLDI